jgi:two-component system, LuxR family, response regulator FixJ
MDKQPTVYVIDDDQAVRTALLRLIGAAGHAAQGFSTATEFLDDDLCQQPGCLLLDFVLPDLNGLELQERLRARHSSMPVIFMSGHGDIPLTVRAMKLGAVDFLPKPVRDVILFAAIESALALEQAQRVAHGLDTDIRARIDSLTPREHEVMDGVLVGRLNKQIARQLHISEKTVKVHRGRVMSKMRVRHVAHLAQLAAQVDHHPIVLPPVTQPVGVAVAPSRRRAPVATAVSRLAG